MMTKILVVISLLVSLVACGQVNEDSYSLRGSAKANSGDIVVDVYVEDKQIKEIDLVESYESRIFTDAIIETIDKVKAKRSLDVEVVSGATISSKATIEAIKDALSKTNEELDFYQNDAVEDKYADVVIVGAGGAGLIAAIEAKMLGIENVRVIEKMPFSGGNTRMSGGEYAAANNFMQEDVGDSPLILAEDIYREGNYIADKSLIDTLSKHANEDLNWLKDEMEIDFQDKLIWAEGHSYPRTVLFDNSEMMYIDKITAKALSLDVQIDYNTTAQALIVEDGKVVGVKTSKANDNINYYASNGVILATGGFGYNFDMVAEYFNNPKLDISQIKTDNSPSITGDGINMAKAINAKLVDMEQIQIYPINNPATNSYYNLDYARILDDAILVNTNGKRFVDEKLNRKRLTDAIIDEEHQTCYEIINPVTIERMDILNEYKEEINSCLKQDVLVYGDLKKCCDRFNLPYENLLNSINSVEGYEYQEGDKLICFISSLSIHYTMGGIAINDKAEVIDNNDEIIENLYAIGEITGGIYGENRIGSISLTETVVFGRIAANTIYNKMLNQ